MIRFQLVKIGLLTGIFTATLLMIPSISHPVGDSEEKVQDQFEKHRLIEGIYTIQHKSRNGRYVDAYESDKRSHDFGLVTRDKQDIDDTMKWIIVPVDGLKDVYTIQQKSTGRFVDAYLSDKRLHDFGVVSRTGKKNDKTQRWIIKRWPEESNFDGLFTIQHMPNMRFVDAYTSSKKDFALVTREFQNDNSQFWHISLDIEDLKFVRVDYSLDDAKIAQKAPEGIHTRCIRNLTGVEQPAQEFRLKGQTEVRSFWKREFGVEVELGVSVGIPKLGGSGSIEISTKYEFTRGGEKTKMHEVSDQISLVVPPSKTFLATLEVIKTEMRVPYVMTFESTARGSEHREYGIWEGTTVSHANIILDDVSGKSSICNSDYQE